MNLVNFLYIYTLTQDVLRYLFSEFLDHTFLTYWIYKMSKILKNLLTQIHLNLNLLENHDSYSQEGVILMLMNQPSITSQPDLDFLFLLLHGFKNLITERGGSVVTHETRIREVPGSNPGADQPDWGFFVVFLSRQGKCWVGFSLPRSIWPLFIIIIIIKFIYHKIKISDLTNETLTQQ